MARTISSWTPGAAWLLFAGLVLCLASTVSAADYKLCFTLYGNVDDLGWTFSFNAGRLNAKTALEALFPTKTFDTMMVPNMASYVAYPTAESREKVFQDLLAAGCNIMVTSGCGYFDFNKGCPVGPQLADWHKRAKAYPNIQFISMWDSPDALNDHTLPNLHFFLMDNTPAYYLAGVAAAVQAKTCVGMMFPIDANRNSHDAASGFALGVQSIKPDMPVHSIMMNSFGAPADEILVTGLFQDAYGCEVTGRYSDPRDADVFVLGRNNGKMSVGSHIDLQRYVGDTVLASCYGQWDKVIVPLISDIITYGTVQASRFPLVYGTKSGAMTVSVISPKAAPGVQAAVDAARLQIAVNDTIICGVMPTVWGVNVKNNPLTGCRNLTEKLPGPVKTKATVYHGGFQTTTYCANGSFASYSTNPTIKLVCTVCPENTFALSGAKQCTPCVQGLIAPPNSSKCFPVVSTQQDATPIIASAASVGGASIFVIAAVVARQRYVGWKKNKRAPRAPPLCLLFTDVEGSTDLWNQNPEAMAVAMNTHHAVIRQVIEENGAYEIKTIGDAFMIACERAIDGVSLAVDIQRALQAAEWPEVFQSKGPFNGLKVRIGVHHCVEVEVKFETLHNYYDYYGNDVNISARVEAFGQGGQICLTQATWREVVDHPDFDSLADAIEAVPWAKDVQLKGVDGGFTMYSIVPRELSARSFQPVSGHENDFNNGNGLHHNDSHTSDTHSTSSSVAMEDVNTRVYAAVISNAFLNVSPPVRRQMISAMSRDLSLQVITNQRRAISAIAVELGKRAGVPVVGGATEKPPKSPRPTEGKSPRPAEEKSPRPAEEKSPRPVEPTPDQAFVPGAVPVIVERP